MKIIYTDKYIAVCEKANGELSEGEGERCIPTLLSNQLRDSGESNINVYPVHRLDKETSGVIVYARDSGTAAKLSESIREGFFVKEYLAIVHGAPKESSGSFSDLLYYDRSRGKSFVTDRQRSGVKEALLDYSIEKTQSGLSLLRVRLHTGRTHQIRVQFASRKMPIVGDRRYGAPKNAVREMALLSFRLSFPHPISGDTLDFFANIPEREPWTYFLPI